MSAGIRGAVQRTLARYMALGAVVAIAVTCSGSDTPLTPDDVPIVPVDTQPTVPVSVANANAAQTAVVGDPFSYDATRAGTAFSDPRHTGLTYTVQLAPSANGFTVTRGVITGVPLATGSTTVTITARDSTGSSASQSFAITTLTNAPVSVVVNFGPQRATVGNAIAIDPTEGGSAFSDPRGTGLTYTVAFSPSANGLTASNGRISGTPLSPGIIAAAVTARDATGRTATINFPIVAFASDLASPTLPAVSFAYSDASVPIPAHFRGGGAPGGPATNADNTPSTNVTTNAGATLGRVLFYDPRLSANDQVSCASCHQQAFAFGDTARLSRGFAGGSTGRHSTGLANARFYSRGRFFWDERAATLEAQALMPIQDATEMGMTLDNLVTKISVTSYYPQLFAAAFGSSDVTSDRISRALSQFVRSLTSAGSRFDQAFGGGGGPNFAAVLTPQENEGLQLFNGGAGCARCHATNAHISDDVHNTGLDATITDVGAGNGRFKAPSLRNIAVRGPYMHDGRFRTLEEVVEFYTPVCRTTPASTRDSAGRVGHRCDSISRRRKRLLSSRSCAH